ncbi:MAG: CBS domain-containing protein [Candidatus Verstraetearchaeota archaeon]|nr:CBS domain-containing protein [Candidatus Verstraetearchaeota archaeon]
MKNPVVTVSKNDTVARARNLMLREGVSRLVVVECSVPIGMITKKDLVADLAKYRMRNRELESITVLELMRAPVKVVNEDASVEEAAKTMVESNIRGLPVVDSGGRLVGIITKTDVTSYYRQYYGGTHKVNEIARRIEETPVVRRTHSLYRVIDLMEAHSADRVIVEEGGKPIGIITETDLSFLKPNRSTPPFIKGVALESEEVSSVRLYQLPTAEALMTHDPIVVEDSSDAVEAAATLMDNGIGGMPVVNREGDLVGMVTKFDFVRAVAGGASA